MIRDYNKSDIDEIIRLYTLEYKAMPEEIEAMRSASKILVYDDNGVKGFVHLEINETYCNMEMGAASDELIKPVGLKLLEEAKKLCVEKSINFIKVCHVKDNLNWQELFNEFGFEYLFSVYRLEYKGTKFSEPDICPVKYEDKYYEDKARIESEAFSQLRKDNDIKPYNWYLSASKGEIEWNRKHTLEQKDYIHLFFENNELMGASKVRDAEIELLFVNVKYQHNGYGKKILQFSINRGLEQNSQSVKLTALASNKKALGLYESTGFNIIQAQDYRKLIIK